MRDYIPPVIPPEWTGASKRYALMIKDSLDDLYENIGDKYSTVQKKTGSTWIDGRSIYRQTFVANVDNNTVYNIRIKDIREIIKAEGFIALSGQYSTGMRRMLGDSVFVRKQQAGGFFRIEATVAGTAYITIYYVLND